MTLALQSLRILLIAGMLSSPSICQVSPESTVLLGKFQNRTGSKELSDIQGLLYKLLSGLPEFPRTILDTALRIDSFPDERSLLNAREMNAAHIIWGSIDSGESGQGITIDILDMVQGSVSHIRTTINRNDNDETVAEMVRSKLQFWLQRTTMVQLIVTTQPPVAQVLLNDTPIGETPFEGLVHPGTYHLELEKNGLLPVRIPASFISGNTYQYDITLGTTEQKIDKRTIFKWLGISVALLGAGGMAHLQQEHAFAKYREATPPNADFNGLYRKAAAWNIGRDVLFAAAGATTCMMIFQAVF
jgi:hypothetical protein